MKKIILFLVILFWIYQNVDAITYGGWNSFYLPNMNFDISGSSYFITPKTSVDYNEAWIRDTNANTKRIEMMSCFRYWTNSTNWYIGIAWNDVVSWNNNWVTYTLEVTDSWVALFDIIRNPTVAHPYFRDSFVQTANNLLAYIPPIPDWLNDDALVFCLRPTFEYETLSSWYTYYLWTAVYMYWFSGSTSSATFVPRNLRIRSVNNFLEYWRFNIYQQPWQQQFWDYTASSVRNNYWKYYVVWTPSVNNNPTTANPLRAFAYEQDFMWMTEYNFVTTLPEFFNSSSTGTYTPYDPWTWTWWTWTWEEVDYFVDCSSFLDVWCYVKWVYDSFYDKIQSLFPNINFAGSWSACPIEEWMQTPIWYSGSNTYIQAIADLMAIIAPIPPPEFTEVCLLWWGDVWDDITAMRTPYGATNGIAPIKYEWFWKTEHHVNWTSMNIFDVLILFLCGMIIYFTIKKSHNSQNIW